MFQRPSYSSSYYSRRSSISVPSSSSYRYLTRSGESDDDLYKRGRSQSASRYSSSLVSSSSSLSSSYKLSSYSSRARSRASLDALNLEYRPYRSSDVTSSRVSARSLNYYAGFSSSYLLGSRSSGLGRYDCDYHRPSYCPSTFRTYGSNLESSWNKFASGGSYYSRMLDSLSLATPRSSVVHYSSYSRPSSSYSYTSPGSGSSWRRKYLDLDTDNDLDGPVGTRRARDSDGVYVDKMAKILGASPNIGVPPEPTCISGSVFLGTSADAENLAMMKALRITYVLNCAGGVGVYSYKRVKDLYGPDTGIQGYEELYADDSENYDIRSCMDRAHAFIDHARSKNARVLIQCPGVSRSGAIAISWLIREGTPLLAATKMVKDKRRNALANTGFMRQLVAYARAKNQLDYDPTSVRAPTYHRVLHKARIMSAHLPLWV